MKVQGKCRLTRMVKIMRIIIFIIIIIINSIIIIIINSIIIIIIIIIAIKVIIVITILIGIMTISYLSLKKLSYQEWYFSFSSKFQWRNIRRLIFFFLKFNSKHYSMIRPTTGFDFVQLILLFLLIHRLIYIM